MRLQSRRDSLQSHFKATSRQLRELVWARCCGTAHLIMCRYHNIRQVFPRDVSSILLHAEEQELNGLVNGWFFVTSRDILARIQKERYKQRRKARTATQCLIEATAQILRSDANFVAFWWFESDWEIRREALEESLESLLRDACLVDVFQKFGRDCEGEQKITRISLLIDHGSYAFPEESAKPLSLSTPFLQENVHGLKHGLPH
mmetsp:Transcript_39540/g.93047  ORF Transcript_39540/g.93047 Transcript_39540/m.93047 type:complete len:204 (+) Transcript_39540:2321-2932(+)